MKTVNFDLQKCFRTCEKPIKIDPNLGLDSRSPPRLGQIQVRFDTKV